MSRRAVVTGAGGFIGYNLANALVNAGWAVAGLDLHYPTAAGAGRKPRFEAYTADFRDTAALRPTLQGAEVLFHLAAAHLNVSLPDSEYWDVNVRSLPALLRAAQEAGVRRVVHVSSVGVYGNLRQWPANEESPKHPQSIYGTTKLEGETLALRTARELGLELTAIRPAWVYGPGCPRTAKLYRTLRKGRFAMIGRGDNLRHPVFIDDLVAAMMVAADHEAAPGQVFLVAGPDTVTSRQLVEAFSQVLATPLPGVRVPYALGYLAALAAEAVFAPLRRQPPISRRSLEFFNTNNAFDTGKARRMLGFEPRVTFVEGLRATAPWLRGEAAAAPAAPAAQPPAGGH